MAEDKAALKVVDAVRIVASRGSKQPLLRRKDQLERDLDSLWGRR